MLHVQNEAICLSFCDILTNNNHLKHAHTHTRTHAPHLFNDSISISDYTEPKERAISK